MSIVVAAVVVALLTAITGYLRGNWGLLWYLLPLILLVLSISMMRGGGLLGLLGIVSAVGAAILALGVTVGLLIGILLSKFRG